MRNRVAVWTLVAMVAVLSGCHKDNNITAPVQPVNAKLVLAVHSATITAGNTIQIGIDTFKVSPAGASTNIIWSSANNAVVTVSQNGTATGVNKGSTYVSATAEANSATKDSVLITVIAAVISLPDLTADAVTPTTTTVGVALTFSSVVRNIGTAGTGVSFSNLFQESDAANGGGPYHAVSINTSSAIAAGGTNPITSSSYTFASAGTYSVRLCADENASFVGTITESNEGNNCGAWTNVVVKDIPQVRSITAPFTSDTLRVGQTQSLKFMVVADSGVVTTYHCLSTNPLVATVDPVTCVVKAWTRGPVDSLPGQPAKMLPIQIVATTDGLNQTQGKLSAGINLFVKP